MARFVTIRLDKDPRLEGRVSNVKTGVFLSLKFKELVSKVVGMGVGSSVLMANEFGHRQIVPKFWSS